MLRTTLPTPKAAFSDDTASTVPEQTLPKLKIVNLNFYYGAYQALHNISLDVAANRITALIGPSGCGKSTFLRVLNRMYETIRDTRVTGEVLVDGESALAMDVAALRRRVGMVFQKPNPFPKSVFD